VNQTAINGSATLLQISQVIRIVNPGVAGVRLMVYQNSTGSLDISSGFDVTYVQVTKLS